MKKINKNGFTMIELLAVITLLGIVMVVAIPNVSRLIEKSKESKMESNKNTLLIATKSYLQANKDQYPKSIGEVKKIEANVLKSSGFLKEDITDGNKKSCMADSYVNVQKKSNGKYSYDVFLICPGDSSPGSTDSELDISGELWYVENGVDKISEDGEEGAHLITKVTLHYKGNGLNLASYSYVVLVSYAGSDDGNYTAIINSDLIKVVGKVQEKDVELDLTGHVDTTRDYYIKVIAKAYDEKGGSKSFETGSRFKNDQAPICGHVKVYDGKTIVKEYNFGENPDFKWVNTPRKVTVECKDNNGSKCKKAKFSQVFTKTGNKLTSGEVDEEGYGYVRIEDNRGRTNDCLVKVNIDTIPPEVPTVSMYKWVDNNHTPNYSSVPVDRSGKSVVYEPGTWSEKYVYTEPHSTDSGSGIDYYMYTTTGKTTNETDAKGNYRNIKVQGESHIKWKACDKLGNCSSYSNPEDINIYIPPSGDGGRPTRPKVWLYKWDGSGTPEDAMKPENIYTPGQWTNTDVIVKYEHDKAEEFNFIYQYVKLYTAVENGGGKRNIGNNYFVIRDEGTTKWNFMVTDVYNNTSYNVNNINGKSASDEVVIKIDKTPPTFQVSLKKDSNTLATFSDTKYEYADTINDNVIIRLFGVSDNNGSGVNNDFTFSWNAPYVSGDDYSTVVASSQTLKLSGGVKEREIESYGKRVLWIELRDNLGNEVGIEIKLDIINTKINGNRFICDSSKKLNIYWISQCQGNNSTSCTFTKLNGLTNNGSVNRGSLRLGIDSSCISSKCVTSSSGANCRNAASTSGTTINKTLPNYTSVRVAETTTSGWSYSIDDGCYISTNLLGSSCSAQTPSSGDDIPSSSSTCHQYKRCAKAGCANYGKSCTKVGGFIYKGNYDSGGVCQQKYSPSRCGRGTSCVNCQYDSCTTTCNYYKRSSICGCEY